MVSIIASSELRMLGGFPNLLLPLPPIHTLRGAWHLYCFRRSHGIIPRACMVFECEDRRLYSRVRSESLREIANRFNRYSVHSIPVIRGEYSCIWDRKFTINDARRKPLGHRNLGISRRNSSSTRAVSRGKLRQLQGNSVELIRGR